MNLINSRKMRNNDERRILKRILKHFITAIIKSQCNNGYRLSNNNKTNIVSTHDTPQWNKFEATIESWHIRNPPTAHHVLYHVVCSYTAAIRETVTKKWHEKGGERYIGNMRIAHCSGLFFISKRLAVRKPMRPFFCLDLGIGPQNDAHVSGPIAVRFVNNSLRQLSLLTSTCSNDTWTTLENCTRPSFSYFSR